MAANHMTLSSQAANLLRVQETLPVNLAGGDKKMPAPAIFLEKARDTRDSAFPAVVEGQKKRQGLITCICEIVRSARGGVAYPCDGRKMGFEVSSTQFVFCRSRTSETARLPVGALDYIMIEQTGGPH
jgi:hypothetical protein